MPAEFVGACHCGAVAVRLWLVRDIAEIDVRACQCSFCRRHGAKTVSDPGGRLTIGAALGRLTRYRFGLRTAESLICAACGCFVAAVVSEKREQRAVLNVAGVAVGELSERNARPVSYDGEDVAGRRTRRPNNWMPVEISNAVMR
jgi:hypothetical protein